MLTGDRNGKYKAIVIGRGEVGRAISSIFNCEAVDISGHAQTHFDYIHICFGWSDEFVEEVKKYQMLYTPQFTIIHSTVPVGTSTKCNAVHSPIRGMHPDLELGVRTHQKFLGGPEAHCVAEYFRDFGLRVLLCDKSETTELGMLLGTECYRINIEFAKHAKELCDKHQVPFNESYTLFANAYNEGWTRLGRPEYIRQVLVPIMSPIGGHCLESNKELIKK
jgi:hypothetical protein